MSTSLIMALGVLVAAAAGAALVWLSRGRTTTAPGDAGAAALVEDLRRQLAEASERRRADEHALRAIGERAASAEATRDAAVDRLRQAEAQHAAAVDQLRADAARAQTEIAARHATDLQGLRASFQALSADVLRGMAPDVTKEVTTRMEPLLAGLRAQLDQYHQGVQGFQTGQQQTLGELRQHLTALGQQTQALASSTNDFTQVLRSSQHRGRWGEQTLRRVVEVSGLSPHCDFEEQVALDNSRPDLIIKLPDHRCVIIDSKVPDFDVALADQAAPNRRDIVTAHARKLKAMVSELAGRQYPTAVAQAARDKGETVVPFPQVILFLPAESLLSTALEGDPDLVLSAGAQQILLATPATLMGFLSAIRLTWQQHQQMENAQNIADAARELYTRVGTMLEHFGRARRGLGDAVASFNSLVGSYTSRVKPAGERLKNLGGTHIGDALPEFSSVDTEVRTLELGRAERDE